MNCPHCGKPINPAAMLGAVMTDAKRASNKVNASKPRPNAKGKPKPRKPPADS